MGGWRLVSRRGRRRIWLPMAAGLALMSSLWSVATAGLAEGKEPGFLAVGDLPYSSEEATQLEALLEEGIRPGSPFLLHVGDIKGGGQRCSDDHMDAIASLFRRQPVPVLYTPGDNEWTDCHRPSAGGMEPLERLEAVRRFFFSDPGVLHQAELAPSVPNPDLPENRWLRWGDVVLALIHVVGSDNNAGSRDPLAVTELAQRTAANRALLDQAVTAANADGAKAMIIGFHANPLFERRRPTEGFRAPLQDLRWVLERYPGPVLVIHGDTHKFRLDQPWAARPNGDRLWRLEVPGSPSVAGVWVSVADDPMRPFDGALVYPPGSPFRTTH
jgi:hypothetical protein